jgi:hypothetical protein
MPYIDNGENMAFCFSHLFFFYSFFLEARVVSQDYTKGTAGGAAAQITLKSGDGLGLIEFYTVGMSANEYVTSGFSSNANLNFYSDATNKVSSNGLKEATYAWGCN